MSTLNSFSGRCTNPAFRKKVADYLGMKVSDAALLNKFSDGEISVQITLKVWVRQDVFIIQPNIPPAMTI